MRNHQAGTGQEHGRQKRQGLSCLIALRREADEQALLEFFQVVAQAGGALEL